MKRYVMRMYQQETKYVLVYDIVLAGKPYSAKRERIMKVNPRVVFKRLIMNTK